MIKVFGQTDKNFTSNGDIIVRPLYATIHKEDNGDYYLDLEASLDYVDYLVAGNIIVANTPQGEQAFRIYNPEKTKSRISLRAWHVFYDSENYLIADSYVVDKNCNNALKHLNNATEPTSEFTVYSDVGTSNSFRCVRKSLYEAIQTVVERWGGHLVRDNFNISILSDIGVDNGVIVQYKKNLKEITCEENWDNVVTKLLPVGKDGILLNAVDSSASIYVQSDVSYPIPYTKTVSFTQDSIVRENYISDDLYKEALVEDLRQQALAYLDVNSVPEVNYTLQANLDRITDIGDTVEVIDERLGVNLLTYVISYEYNCILEKYTEIEFGNFKKTLSGLVSNITASVDKTVTEKTDTAIAIMTSKVTQAKNSIMSVMENGFVTYDGDKIMIVDKLPKESAEKVIMISSEGIEFSNNGIYGNYRTAWNIDGTLNMDNINVINLMADMIQGGTLKLGSYEDADIELHDSSNNVICQMNNDGLKMFGLNGSYIIVNREEGFTAYDRNGNKILWITQDEVRTGKASVDELNLCDKFRFIQMEQTDGSGNIINEGIGLI